MDKSIRQLFFDKNNNIYIVDENNVLYLFNQGLFYPFAMVFDDIKECFSFNELFFVYHSNTMTIFDEKLHKNNYVNQLWITNNINEICYNPDYKIVCTLEQNEIYCTYNVTSTSFLEDIYKDQIILRDKYHSIKIINDMLLSLSDHVMDIFYITTYDIVHIRSLQIEPNIFSNIFNYSESQFSFLLSNGNIFIPPSINSFDDDFLNTNKYFSEISLNHNIRQTYNRAGTIKKTIIDDKITNIEYFHENNEYFTINDRHILGFYKKIHRNTILQLVSLIPSNKLDIVDYDDKEIILLSINEGINIIIKNNETSHIILYDNKIYFINEDDDLCESKITDETICMEYINNCSSEKDYNTIFIDINPAKSIIDQLLNVIPPIYRLNNELSYAFEHISSSDITTSYGEGTTRQTYSLLRKELDTILKNNFVDMEPHVCYNIGKIFYFCVFKGKEKFTNIHPYFFYAISNEFDHLILLKKFKADKFEMYKNQYIEYKLDSCALINLDIGLETHNDYIKYIFTSNLSDKIINLYDEFIKGFNFFAIRNKYNQLLKKLPITYYIDNILIPNYLTIEIIFNTTYKFVDTEEFGIFCEKINKKISELTNKEMLYLIQNITGCQYYNKAIEIIYAPNIVTSTVNSAITDIDSNCTNIKDTIYEISTCNAQLIIYIDAIAGDIESVINCLTIEDPNLKN